MQYNVQFWYGGIHCCDVERSETSDYFFGAEEQFNQRFFSRDCGIRMTEGKLCDEIARIHLLDCTGPHRRAQFLISTTF